jgi:MraZ protein
VEYLSTLDDKGRISLPAKLRSGLNNNSLMLTKGENVSLYVILPDNWPQFEEDMLSRASTLAESNLVRRVHIAPKVEAEIDKVGRIAIPPSLRKHAKLVKDCLILEVGDRLEIWDCDCYDAYVEANREKLQSIMER